MLKMGWWFCVPLLNMICGPAGSRRSREYLVIGMEQRLIHHFQIFDTDRIVVNETFDAGETTHTKDSSHDILSISVRSDNPDLDLTDNRTPPEAKYHAYVVYMTFTYLPPKEDWPKLRKEQEQELEEEKRKKEERNKKEEKREQKAKETEWKKAEELQRKEEEKQKEAKEIALDDESISEASLTKSAMSAFSEYYPLFSSTPISSPKESISSTTSALSSKENIPPLSTSSPLSTVRKDLLPALEELLQTTQ